MFRSFWPIFARKPRPSPQRSPQQWNKYEDINHRNSDVSPPFRIVRAGVPQGIVPEVGGRGGPPPPAGAAAAGAPGAADDMSFYLDKLMKMIPTEVIGLYLVGSGIIPDDQHAYLLGWSTVCLIGVVIARIAGTRDKAANKPPQAGLVVVSAIAFVIWVYSLGGPFKWYMGANYKPFLGSLFVLVWTFVVPLVYTPAD